MTTHEAKVESIRKSALEKVLAAERAQDKHEAHIGRLEAEMRATAREAIQRTADHEAECDFCKNKKPSVSCPAVERIIDTLAVVLKPVGTKLDALRAERHSYDVALRRARGALKQAEADCEYADRARRGGGTVCGGCGGHGRYYSGGAVVNGHYTGRIGKCFRCGGKGYQTSADERRNYGYDKHRRITAY